MRSCEVAIIWPEVWVKKKQCLKPPPSCLLQKNNKPCFPLHHRKRCWIWMLHRSFATTLPNFCTNLAVICQQRCRIGSNKPFSAPEHKARWPFLETALGMNWVVVALELTRSRDVFFGSLKGRHVWMECHWSHSWCTLNDAQTFFQQNAWKMQCLLRQYQ